MYAYIFPKIKTVPLIKGIKIANSKVELKGAKDIAAKFQLVIQRKARIMIPIPDPNHIVEIMFSRSGYFLSRKIEIVNKSSRPTIIENIFLRGISNI